MMKEDKATVEIKIILRFNVSFWDCIKARIFGIEDELKTKIVNGIIDKIEAIGNREDSAK